MKTISLTNLLVIGTLLLSSCGYNHESDYIQPAQSIGIKAEDTVFWSKDIKPIIVHNCANSNFCHNNFKNYTSFKDAINTGLVQENALDTINSNMPPTGKMPNDTIRLIQRWINQGALNN